MKKRKTMRRKSHKERRLRNRLRRQQAMDRTIEAPEGFMSDPATDPGTFYWEQRLPVIMWTALAAAVIAALAALVLK